MWQLISFIGLMHICICFFFYQSCAQLQMCIESLSSSKQDSMGSLVKFQITQLFLRYTTEIISQPYLVHTCLKIRYKTRNHINCATKCGSYNYLLLISREKSHKGRESKHALHFHCNYVICEEGKPCGCRHVCSKRMSETDFFMAWNEYVMAILHKPVFFIAENFQYRNSFWFAILMLELEQTKVFKIHLYHNIKLICKKLQPYRAEVVKIG